LNKHECNTILQENDNPVPCSICNKIFPRKENLRKHMKTHDGNRPYACSICEKTFHQKSRLKAHEMGHKGEKPFACSACDKTFTTKYYLKNHELMHSGVRVYGCQFCEKSFISKQSLDNHERTHTGEKPFQCKVCIMAFASQTSLKKHEVTHTGEKRFSCDSCGKRFGLKQSLKAHSKAGCPRFIDFNEEKPFACDQCDKKFTQNSELTQHKIEHTWDLKPSWKRYLSCADCGQKFETKQSLDVHQVESIGSGSHLKPKPPEIEAAKKQIKIAPKKPTDFAFSCDICGKTFTQNSQLTQHKIAHTWEKFISCLTCGGNFNSKQHLEMHRATGCNGQIKKPMFGDFVLAPTAFNGDQIKVVLNNVKISNDFTKSSAAPTLAGQSNLNAHEHFFAKHCHTDTIPASISANGGVNQSGNAFLQSPQLSNQSVEMAVPQRSVVIKQWVYLGSEVPPSKIAANLPSSDCVVKDEPVNPKYDMDPLAHEPEVVVKEEFINDSDFSY